MADWTLPNSVDDLTPHSQYLFERLGMAKRSQQALDTAAQDAMRGTTPDMAKVQARLAELQNQLTQVVQQSIHLPREDFDRLKQQMVDTFSQQVQMPQRQNPQAPNLGQSLAAGLGAILDPRHAASIAATPYQYQNQRAEQGYQDSMAQYGEAQRQKQNAVGFYGDMLGLQDRQDRATYQQQLDDRNTQIGLIQDQMKRLDADIARAQTAQDKLTAEQNKAKFSNALRTYYDSGADIKDKENAWTYLTQEAGMALQPPAKTYKQAGSEAKTDLTREQIADIVAMRPWKVKGAEAKYNQLIAQTGLTESQKALVDMRVAYYPDEFRLEKAKLEIARMNADTARMNAEGKGKAGASEGRLALNAQRQSLTALLTLNRSQIKAARDEGDEDAVQALTQEQNDYKSQLYDINEQLQGKPKPDHSITDFLPGDWKPEGPINGGNLEPVRPTLQPGQNPGRPDPSLKPKPKQPKPSPRIRIVNIREHK